MVNEAKTNQRQQSGSHILEGSLSYVDLLLGRLKHLMALLCHALAFDSHVLALACDLLALDSHLFALSIHLLPLNKKLSILGDHLFDSLTDDLLGIRGL